MPKHYQSRKLGEKLVKSLFVEIDVRIIAGIRVAVIVI